MRPLCPEPTTIASYRDPSGGRPSDRIVFVVTTVDIPPAFVGVSSFRGDGANGRGRAQGAMAAGLRPGAGRQPGIPLIPSPSPLGAGRREHGLDGNQEPL